MGIRNSDENLNLAVRVSFMPPSLTDAATVLDSNFIGSWSHSAQLENYSPEEPAFTSGDDFAYAPAMDPNPPYEALEYTPPSNEDVYTQWKLMFDEYSTSAVYRLQRETEYPSLGEQLDALYHDIENGTISTSGAFASLIKEVKDTYPKS
jgi:hypothetical protein